MVEVVRKIGQTRGATGPLIDFCIVHDGKFESRTHNQKVIQYYKGGDRSYFYSFPSATLNLSSLKDLVKSVSKKGFSNVYYQIPGTSMCSGLLCMFNDDGVKKLVNYGLSRPQPLEIFIDHVLAEGLQNNGNQNTENEVDVDDEDGNASENSYVTDDDKDEVMCDPLNEENDELIKVREKRKEYKKKKISEKKSDYLELLMESTASMDKMLLDLSNPLSGEGECSNEGEASGGDCSNQYKSGEGQSSSHQQEENDNLEPNLQNEVLVTKSPPIIDHVAYPEDDFLDQLGKYGSDNVLSGYESEYKDSDDEYNYMNDVNDLEGGNGDSDDDEDYDADNDNVVYPIFDPKTEIEKIEPMSGMRYTCVQQLRHCLISYAVFNGYELNWYKNEKKRLIVTCRQGCEWRLHATVMQNENSFQIKSIKEQHTCVRNYSALHVKAPWLARQYGKYLREHPKTTGVELQDMVSTDFGITVPINRCYAAKKKALRQVQMALKHHYARLGDYAEELCKSNPGSTVVMKKTESVPHHFLRFYICLNAIKKGWLAGCRPFIGLDGCFLKTVCKGELLCAVGRDGNNEMFPIAWAIVENERYDTWAWFINLLIRDLNSDDGEGWTIMSDQQKGLVQAIKDYMPAAEHRCCARHIYANFRKTNTGVQLRALFWQATYAGTKEELGIVMDEMKGVSLDAYNYFWRREPHVWCRAFFSDRSCVANVENNMDETFNGYILHARDKPIIIMLEEIRVALMNRMHKKKEYLLKQTDQICPKIRKIVEKNKRAQKYWKVTSNGEQGFEVRQGLEGYVVKLHERTCSCRLWQLSGIPCVHSCAAINFINDNPDRFIADYFLVSKAIQAYNWMLQPVNGEKLWPKSPFPPVLPPIVHVRTGRPKKNRRKEAHEGGEKQSVPSNVDQRPPRKNIYEISRKGRKMTCSNCGEKDHNKRGCKKEKVVQEKVKKPLTCRCSLCKEIGHNKTTCPTKDDRAREEYVDLPDGPLATPNTQVELPMETPSQQQQKEAEAVSNEAPITSPPLETIVSNEEESAATRIAQKRKVQPDFVSGSNAKKMVVSSKEKEPKEKEPIKRPIQVQSQKLMEGNHANVVTKKTLGVKRKPYGQKAQLNKKAKIPEGFGVLFDDKGQTIEVVGKHANVPNISSTTPGPNEKFWMGDGQMLTRQELVESHLKSQKITELEKQLSESEILLFGKSLSTCSGSGSGSGSGSVAKAVLSPIVESPNDAKAKAVAKMKVKKEKASPQRRYKVGDKTIRHSARLLSKMPLTKYKHGDHINLSDVENDEE